MRPCSWLCSLQISKTKFPEPLFLRKRDSPKKLSTRQFDIQNFDIQNFDIQNFDIQNFAPASVAI